VQARPSARGWIIGVVGSHRLKVLIGQLGSVAVRHIIRSCLISRTLSRFPRFFFTPSQSEAYSGWRLISCKPVAHRPGRIIWRPHRARARARIEAGPEDVRQQAMMPNSAEAVLAAAA